MTIYVGGMRDRLIHDSLFNLVKSGLTALGWFNVNPTGFTNPINMIAEQVPWDQEIPLNSITVAPGYSTDEEFELGVFAFKNEKQYYIDVYGENEALSIQLSGDIKDILRGKFPSLGFSQATLNVFDYTQATPSFIFFCDIDAVKVDRTQNFPHLWQKFMYTISLNVCDFYTNDQDAFEYGQEG